MKKIVRIGTAVLLALCCTGCASKQNAPDSNTESSQVTEQQAEGLVVKAGEDVDEAYAECLKTYFEALDNDDFAGYQKTVYPPYQEVYAAFIKDNFDSLEDFFHQDLCKHFDEDGYDSWKLTEIQLSACPPEREDTDNFLQHYVSAGVFDDEFVEKCKADATEIHDIYFTLYALYEGDEEPVPVVTDGEIFVLKNADGAYMFG